LIFRRRVLTVLSGLVYAYDKGTKVGRNDVDVACCQARVRSAVDSFLEAKLAMIQPYLEGNEPIDLKILPPFLAYLVYKCAAIVTERLRIGEGSFLNINALKGLRGFLALLSQRWLAGSKISTKSIGYSLLNKNRTVFKVA
jgi:hypothetical protein